MVSMTRPELGGGLSLLLIARLPRAQPIHPRRNMTDLPAEERVVRLRLFTRRFWCNVGTCQRDKSNHHMMPNGRLPEAAMEFMSRPLDLPVGGSPNYWI